ncbi:hypothetical protein [Blastomonas sp.]|uniref:hypothetical protein n=1 Tax=Blastomonas sp. TaxID=1909299 RepID=UPI003593B22D
MKNVTIALDNETHRLARIRAAELGTSLSALVKGYLQGLADGVPPADMPDTGVREMPMSFSSMQPGDFVPLKKPRQPGAMRGQIHMADDFNETPQWLIDAMEGKDSTLSWPQE